MESRPERAAEELLRSNTDLGGLPAREALTLFMKVRSKGAAVIRGSGRREEAVVDNARPDSVKTLFAFDGVKVCERG